MAKHEYKLISGEFTTEEAKEVLVKLFLNKIQFHEFKNFSTNERIGEDDPVSVKRIPELKQSLADIKAILASADFRGSKVKIKTYVEISKA